MQHSGGRRPGQDAPLRVMADDFRCQVKQIIADFKAERIAGDISVGIVALAFYVWPCRSVKKTQRSKMLR